MNGRAVRWWAAVVAVVLGVSAHVHSAAAQDFATLLADTVQVDPAGRITAEGNVVIHYQGTRLEAARVTYERSGDRLSIDGPITVVTGDGEVLTAEFATLDRTLREGVLVSARMVLDRQLQLASAEIARMGQRYTQLSRVVASSCEICADNPVPLWEIRAQRVIHDTEERQLYFENATLRLAGVPVVYLPRLRLPDPTLDRASGFLIPRIQTSSRLGTGFKFPYFLKLGDHADLTLTPYLSTSTTTLEYQFRGELRGGSVEATGAISGDDIDGGRAFLFADAQYRLPRGFVATGQLELVSDPGYLYLYGYSDKDRLTNSISIDRVRERDLFRSSVTEFRTLRDSEIPIRDTLPDRFIEVSYIRDIPALAFGARATARIDAAALNRPSSADVLGRDVSRLGLGLDWTRTAVFGPGVVVRGELGLRGDAYNVGQDSNFKTNQSRLVSRGAAELRWPFFRAGDAGSIDIVEPVARLDFATVAGGPFPLEDSRTVEFDEGNLFSFSRYPGIDGVEDGARVALGMSWRRSHPDGWTMDLALGRLLSLDGDLGFGVGSGLAGDQSEWLVSARLGLGDRLWLGTRSLFDDNFAFTLSETRLDWQTERGNLTTSFLLAEPEPAEDRLERLSEWSLAGAYGLNDNWTASADWRYDLQSGELTRAGVGLDYENECIRLDLSLSRRFATSTSVAPTTEFGFRVSLLGVGNGTKPRRARRQCRG